MKTVTIYTILSSIIFLSIFFSKSANPQTKLIKIAVVDTGFYKTNTNVKLCPEGHKDFTGLGLEDNHGHGTHIINTITNYIDDNTNYCIIVIKWFDTEFTNISGDACYNAFKYILEELPDVNIINFSAAGALSIEKEKKVFAKLLAKGVIVNVAAGNENINLDKTCISYPACYNLKGMNVVGNLNFKGERYLDSNYGTIVNIWEKGVGIKADAGKRGVIKLTGTSQSTAITTAKMVKGLK